MPRILTRLKINEVSSVDRGAGEGVRVMIVKRDDGLPPGADAYLKRTFSADDRKRFAAGGAAMPDGGYPIENVSDLENAIQAFGRAKNPDATKRHIIARARALGAIAKLPQEWTMSKGFTDRIRSALGFGGSTLADTISDAGAALHKSVQDILTDAALDQAAKQAAVQKQFGAFAERLDGSVPDSVAQALTAAGIDPALFTKGEGHMANDNPETAAALAKAQAELAKAKTELAIAKMSGAHSKYCADMGMDDDAKGKFAAMSDAERDAHMTKHPVKKADESLPSDVQKRLADAEKLEKRLVVLEGERALADFTKRATDVGLPTDMGVVLQKAYTGEGTDRSAAVDKLLDLVKSMLAAETGASIFKEIGSRGDGSASDDPMAQLTAKAEELRKAHPELTQAAAFAKVYADPANAKLALAERRANRPAAA